MENPAVPDAIEAPLSLQMVLKNQERILINQK